MSQSERFTASDGVSLQTTLTAEDGVGPRPTIVEFSPYGRASGTINAGTGFNYLLVQIRGTGDSDGQFDALGPRTQQDVHEVLDWACHQPWSDGSLGLNGFSASAITIYNSMHLTLPCVKAMVLKSGTFELYRDLLVPGGINNIVPGAGVLGLIGFPALEQGGDRLARDPASSLDVIQGLFGTGLDEIQHPALDDWWRERGFRGDVNHVPILMLDGFFDVESRGAFQAYQALRGDGAHLVVGGGHDAAPAGTDGGAGDAKAWFEHYLAGVDNGIESQPQVKLRMSEGDREDYVNGKYRSYDASDWPVPGTDWEALKLDPAPSGTAHSLNDGSLGLGDPATEATQSYPTLPSMSTMTDPPNSGIIGSAGFDALTTGLPILSDMTLAEPLGLSYTTKPLASDVQAAGPLDLDVTLSTTSSESAIWAVISDVSPDGTPHPVAAGRLNTAFPGVDEGKSLKDSNGDIVQPYGLYDAKSPADAGQERRYHVELWPIGNQFDAGHRIRLHLVGQSLASLPPGISLNTVRVGGSDPSRLMFPVLPGSDLSAALGGGY